MFKTSMSTALTKEKLMKSINDSSDKDKIEIKKKAKLEFDNKTATNVPSYTIEEFLSSDESDSDESSKSKTKVTRISKRNRFSKLSRLNEDEKKSRQKDQMKDWRTKNPDYSKTYRQRYYQEHREEILEKRRLKRIEEKKILDAYENSRKLESKS